MQGLNGFAKYDKTKKLIYLLSVLLRELETGGKTVSVSNVAISPYL